MFPRLFNNKPSSKDCQSPLKKNLIKNHHLDTGIKKRTLGRYILSSFLNNYNTSEVNNVYSKAFPNCIFSKNGITGADTSHLRKDLKEQNPNLFTVVLNGFRSNFDLTCKARNEEYASFLESPKGSKYRVNKIKEARAECGDEWRVPGTEAHEKYKLLESKSNPLAIRKNIPKSKTLKYKKRNCIKGTVFCTSSKPLEQVAQEIREKLGTEGHFSQVIVKVNKSAEQKDLDDRNRQKTWDDRISISTGFNFDKMSQDSRIAIEKRIMYVVCDVCDRLQYSFSKKKEDTELYTKTADKIVKQYIRSQYAPKSTLETLQKRVGYFLRHDFEKNQKDNTLILSENKLCLDNDYKIKFEYGLLSEAKKVYNKTELFGLVMNKKRAIKKEKASFNGNDKVNFMKELLEKNKFLLDGCSHILAVFSIGGKLLTSTLKLLFDAVIPGRSERYQEKKLIAMKIKEGAKSSNSADKNKSKYYDLTANEQFWAQKYEEFNMTFEEKILALTDRDEYTKLKEKEEKTLARRPAAAPAIQHHQIISRDATPEQKARWRETQRQKQLRSGSSSCNSLDDMFSSLNIAGLSD